MAEFALAQPVHHDVYPFISPHDKLQDAAKGKTVLITGAGSGIGKAIAHTFAQASASTIVLVGRRLEPLQQVQAELNNTHPTCRTLLQPHDVSNPDAVATLFQTLHAHALTLDVLVNNAGASGAFTTIEDSAVDDWSAVLQTNLHAPYLLTRALLRTRTSASPPAVVINTSSASSHNALPTLPAYCVSKAALNRLTELAAREGEAKNLRCVGFNPGRVPGTEMTDRAPRAWMAGVTETAELSGALCLYLTTERAAWANGRYVDARWDVESLEAERGRIEGEALLRMTVVGDVRVMP